MSLSSAPSLQVSKHFPVVRRQCKEVAAIFFHCFQTHAEMKDEHDKVGSRPFQNCQSEMQSYDECMSRIITEERSIKLIH